MAFEAMGGVETLAAWGRDNPGDFYKIWARLIPREPVETEKQQQFGRVVLYLPDDGRESLEESESDVQRQE